MAAPVCTVDGKSGAVSTKHACKNLNTEKAGMPEY
jgi:hypothetical protein